MPKITRSGSTFSGHRMVGVERDATWRTECTSPKFVEVLGVDGYRTSQVACGKCKHCLWSKRESRATAVAFEIEKSEWALWLTLTIGPQGEPHGYHKVIDKSLMQNFHKLCRIHMDRKTQGFAGRDVTSWRYVQCGEYGERKGRAHYHAVIFGKGDRPVWGDRDADRIHIPEWPWGHVNVKTHVDRGVAYYLAKYMSKGEPSKSWTSASCAYAIGGEKAREIGRQLRDLAMIPAINWRCSTRDAMGRVRRALVTGSKQREILVGFFEGSARSVVSCARLWPKAMLPSVMRHEVEIRRRALGLSRTSVLRIERIKRQVRDEMYKALGLTTKGRYGGPVKPDGWRFPEPCRSDADGDEAKQRAAAASFSMGCSAVARAAASAGRDVSAAVAAFRQSACVGGGGVASGAVGV